MLAQQQPIFFFLTQTRLHFLETEIRLILGNDVKMFLQSGRVTFNFL